MKNKLITITIMLITMLFAMSGVAMAEPSECSSCGGGLFYFEYDGSKHFYRCTDCGTYNQSTSHTYTYSSNGPWNGHTKSCTGCTYSTTESHTDKYNYISDSDTDCYYLTCTKNCGRRTSNLEHSWDSGSVTTAATCTSTGVMTYTCENKSSHTKTETIAKNASNHSSTATTTTYSKNNASCIM